jgi:hypothetical protein
MAEYSVPLRERHALCSGNTLGKLLPFYLPLVLLNPLIINGSLSV